MSEWIRAEDAPDFIKKGELVLYMSVNDAEPGVIYFDPNYDRRSKSCKGFFFMKWKWPKKPVIDHSLPDRIEP